MGDGNPSKVEPAPSGEKWGDAIDEARKQELWARLCAWWDEVDHGERKRPFEEERLTGVEVCWLVVCALARKADTTTDMAEKRPRDGCYPVNLVPRCLNEANLRGSQF